MALRSRVARSVLSALRQQQHNAQQQPMQHARLFASDAKKVRVRAEFDRR